MMENMTDNWQSWNFEYHIFIQNYVILLDLAHISTLVLREERNFCNDENISTMKNNFILWNEINKNVLKTINFG